MMEIVFFMGDLIQVVTVCVLKDQRATRVSARQERAPARYVRAARSVFRVVQTTVGGFGD